MTISLILRMRLFVKAEPSTVKHRRHYETLALGRP